MPAKAPHISPQLAQELSSLGRSICKQRKNLGLNTTVTAEAAGISRVTLHRVERGEPSVTIGAYLNVLHALGMELQAYLPGKQPEAHRKLDEKKWIPARIFLADYPQLKQLAWQVHGTEYLTPPEALSIYERNWRHLDLAAMEKAEKNLIEALQTAFARRKNDV
jgi:transcriptional regulator with XRE-family HTH domain